MHRGGTFFDRAEPARPSGDVSTRALGGRIARLFAPHRRTISLLVLSIVLTAGLGVVNPLMIKEIFDTSLFCGAGCPNLHRLVVLVSIMVAVPVVTGIVGIGQTYLTNTVGQRVMEDLRNTLYSHLQGMSLRFFTATKTGEIQSRITNDVNSVETVVSDTASSILANIVILITTVIAMLVLSWQLTALSLCLVPVFVVLTSRAGRLRREIVRRTQESRAEMTSITEETLSVSGVLLAKVFGRRQDEMERFRRENRRQADLAIRQEMVGRTLFAVVGAFFSAAPALVYLIAGVVIANNAHSGITAGTIVAFTTLQSRLFFPVGQMLQISVEVLGSLALFERIFAYLDLPHDIVTKSDAVRVDASAMRGEVALEGVGFRYLEQVQSKDPTNTRREWAIQDLSLRVRPGQLAAIVGPSGAGKTTISYLIPRLYDVNEGRVTLDGIDVRDIALDCISDIVSMVTQETYLFHASVRQNLLYAKPDATDEEMERACRAAFIHDRITQLTDGYDTLVGERGYRMSGGEKQRLAIARVALRAPRVLILDEATSALDTNSEKLVQAALHPLMAGRTTIAIAHRLSTILSADVIFVIDSGRLAEQGTHDELIRRGGIYAQLYELQFQGGRVEALCEDGIILSSGEVINTEPVTPAG